MFYIIEHHFGLVKCKMTFSFLQVRARAKVEKIRASLFNSSDLIGLSSLDGEEGLMEITEEILTASSVNQSLFDTQGSSALEDYFLDKTIRGWNSYMLLHV